MVEIKKLQFFFVNAYVIKGEKTILFDTGAVIPPEALPGFLEENGVDPKEIDLIVISHAHWDHAQLAKAWKDLTGAKILCHKNAVEALKTGKTGFVFGTKAKEYQPLSWMVGMFNLPPTKALTYQPFIDFMESTAPPSLDPVEPDIIMGDEDFDLHPYGIPGKLIYTPGHTDTAITLVTDDRIAFTGDTIVDLHTIQCLECVFPEGTYSLNWINNGDDMIKNSVIKLLEEADTFYGGHGVTFTRDEVEPLVK